VIHDRDFPDHLHRRDVRDRLVTPRPAAVRPVAADVAVAPARFGDLLPAARMQRRAFRPGLAYGLTTLAALWLLPHVRFLVARQGGRVVGCAIGDRDGADTRVINLAVDPDARRRGVGTSLLRGLEAALTRGNLLLMVEAENLGAQALYRGEGYLPVGDAVDYYGRGRHGIWMQKQRVPGAPTKIRV